MSQHHACTDPSHHVHDGDAFVHEVERACEARGLRLTPIRAHARSTSCTKASPSWTWCFGSVQAWSWLMETPGLALDLGAGRQFCKGGVDAGHRFGLPGQVHRV